MDATLDSLARYFHFEVEGAGYIPHSGGAVVVSPHGLLPIDGLLLSAAIRQIRGRTLRGMSHPYWFKVPGIRGALSRLGFEVGTRGAALKLLQGGHILHTMPGGVREAFRPSEEAHQLRWEGRLGYLRLALKAGVAIIPAATSGVDSLYRVTSTPIPFSAALFPGLGQGIPLAYGRGPLPWPLALPERVRLKAHIGPPIDHGLVEADLSDEHVLMEGHRRVQGEILRLWRGGVV